MEMRINLLKHNLCESFCKYLSPKEEKILRLRWGYQETHPHSLGEIAYQFDLTRARIYQIIIKAKYKVICGLKQKNGGI